MIPIEVIARIAHEANRIYCTTLADFSQQSWEACSNWQRISAIKGVQFHLEHLRSGQAPDPAASHNAWLEEKLIAGWKYGPVKDAEKKEHPCFMPYEELPIEQQQKDFLFAAIVKAFYDCQNRGGHHAV